MVQQSEPTTLSQIPQVDNLQNNESFKILVADDARDILNLICFHLRRAGYTVFTAENGQAALEIAEQEDLSLAILDWMMPEVDGVEVCKRLRGKNPTIYIILLTALNSEDQRVSGLEAGADDYVTKPFSGRELVARVKAMMRRIQNNKIDGAIDVSENLPLAPMVVSPAAANFNNLTLNFGLAIDAERRQVRKGVQEIELTKLEFDLLKFLSENPGLVFSRDQLLGRVWNYDYIGDERVVDVHMARLRKKLEDDPARPRYIQTIRGVGYKYTP